MLARNWRSVEMARTFQDYPKANAYLGDLLFVYVLVT